MSPSSGLKAFPWQVSDIRGLQDKLQVFYLLTQSEQFNAVSPTKQLAHGRLSKPPV
jgi:hypothetical protein